MTDATEFLVDRYHLDLKNESPFYLVRQPHHYLPRLFRDLGFNRGAEIGIEEGVFALHLCRIIPKLTLYCIDPWLSYGYYVRATDQEKMDRKYEKATERLAPYNCEIIRAFSVDAVKQFEDESLDFVRIDANHGFMFAYQDIALWSQKVRRGGIVSGDDYFNSTVPGRCRVKDAVDLWTCINNIHPWFVTVYGRRITWFYVKD